ncbi:uncharacterized protein LOC126191378 [Schistocerca cancellata]|uniref:uncharacterized protein LOC126191378 n=1 Tax=Schistocerca cancellata TaxID=274614 RepID=UPI002117F340|nr:uncharacterized protein LOC126191378 [Schistocerca cancellata]
MSGKKSFSSQPGAQRKCEHRSHSPKAVLPTSASGWSRDPTEDQQRYYELLGDVYVYEPNSSRELLILRRKVGYAIYGIPDEEPKCDNAHTGYSESKYKTVKAVVEFIRYVNKKTKEKDELHMAIIFVFVEHQKQVLQFPVFRILLTETTWKFVDMNCRVYSSWQDYLTHNELPEGKFCWPLKGIYSADSNDKVQLGWGSTPAAQPGRKVVKVADTVSTVAALGATGMCVVGVFTPLGPLMAAAGVCSAVSSIYSAIRSATSLADRGIHGQTVNPFTDGQALTSWFSMAGNVFGAAAGAAASRAATLAMNGRVMSKTGEIVRKTLEVTSALVSVTGVGIGAMSSGERVKKGKATPLEVFQFSASLLFLAHATVSFQTASKIIEDIQKGVIDNFERNLRSNRHRKQLKLGKNIAGTGEDLVDGNERVIRGIRSIGSKDDFLAGMVRTREDCDGHKPVFSENVNNVENGGAEINQKKLCDLGKQQRGEILSLAKQASQGKISDAILKACFDSVLSINTTGTSGRNFSEDTGVAEPVSKLTSQLQQGIQGITIGRNEIILTLAVVEELTVQVCSKTDNKYTKWWHLIWHHVSKLVRELCNAYDAVTLEKQIPNFTEKRQFDLVNGIQMANVFMHFVFMVYNQYKDHVEQLINDIKKSKANEICEKCNQAM